MCENGEGPQKRQKLVSLQVSDINLDVNVCYEEAADSNSLHEWPTGQDVFDHFLHPDYSLQDQQNSPRGIAASSTTPAEHSFADYLSFEMFEVRAILRLPAVF